MRIIVWGTGSYAESFYRFSGNLRAQIIGFTESIRTKNSFLGLKVLSVEDLKNVQWDIIVVASSYSEDIRNSIKGNGIDNNRVVYLNEIWIGSSVSNDALCFHLDTVFDKPVDESVFFAFNGVYFTSKQQADLVKARQEPSDYWGAYQDFNTSEDEPFVTQRQKAILERSFISELKQYDNVLDYGCASGEWSRYLAPYVSQIEGVDISSDMIETATRKSFEAGIKNTFYRVGDVREIEPDHQFNHIIMLGLLIYIEDDEEVKQIVANLSSLMLDRGLLATRCTLLKDYDNPMYFVKEERGFKLLSTYRSIRWYEKLFLDNGFQIVDSDIISQYYNKPMNLGVKGYVFRKGISYK